MAKERSLVRASDIGAWVFCHRAWWLAQVKGVPHRRPEQLARGNEMHTDHGRQVAQAGWLGRAGWLLIALGSLVALLTLLARFWG